MFYITLADVAKTLADVAKTLADVAVGGEHIQKLLYTLMESTACWNLAPDSWIHEKFRMGNLWQKK